MCAGKKNWIVFFSERWLVRFNRLKLDNKLVFVLMRQWWNGCVCLAPQSAVDWRQKIPAGSRQRTKRPCLLRTEEWRRDQPSETPCNRNHNQCHVYALFFTDTFALLFGTPFHRDTFCSDRYTHRWWWGRLQITNWQHPVSTSGSIEFKWFVN